MLLAREPEPVEGGAAIGEGSDLKLDVDRWSHFTDDSSLDRVELDGPSSTFPMPIVENRDQNEKAGPMSRRARRIPSRYNDYELYQ